MMDGNMKRCSTCGEEKLRSEFYRDKSGRDGLRGDCKVCNCAFSAAHYADNAEEKCKYGRDYYAENKEVRLAYQREYRAENRFAVTLNWSVQIARRRGYLSCSATVEELEASFTGRCHVCGMAEEENGRRLCIDHDHEGSGAFRGWLCTKCNTALGLLQDSSEIIAALLLYRQKSEANLRL